jgi:thiamine-monophosphate kinase
MAEMFENESKPNLDQLGEFGLIDHLLSNNATRRKETVLSTGDDACLIDAVEGRYQVISTDMLVEGVHFDLMYTPLAHLGYKAVVVNLSDICAMNARPEQVLVSIALSSKFTLDAVEELYKGIYLACEKYEIDLVGGDTSSSQKGLIIGVTAIGSVEKGREVKRSGAKSGDLLCVTGDLGGAYMGLQLLEREKRVFIENPAMQPELDGFDYILQRQLKPEARVDAIEFFLKHNILPTSMIDVSDGLSSEVLHLSKQSEVGFKIYEEKLPIDHQTTNLALEFNIDPNTAVLNGGEDYELLFTLPQSDFDHIKNSPDISVIGYAVEKHEGNQLITKSGGAYDLKAQGWKSF